MIFVLTVLTSKFQSLQKEESLSKQFCNPTSESEINTKAKKKSVLFLVHARVIWKRARHSFFFHIFQPGSQNPRPAVANKIRKLRLFLRILRTF